MIFGRAGWISIALTIVLIFVGLVVLLLGSVMAVNYVSGLRNTLNLVGEVARQSSEFVVEELRDHLDSVVEQSTWVAQFIATGPVDLADDQELGQFLLGALAATPQVAMLSYVAPDLRSVRGYRGERGETWRLDSGRPPDLGFAERTLRAAEATERGFWNEVFYSERSGRSYINYVQPVWRDGAFLGYVLALVSLNELSDIVSDVSDHVRGTVFVLIERDQVIAHPNLTSSHPELSKQTPTVGITRVGDLVLASFWSADSKPLKVTSDVGGLELRTSEIDGQHYVLAHVSVDGYGDNAWIVGQYLDAERAKSALRPLRESALVGLIIMVIGVVLAVILGRAIARPIQAASSEAAHIAELEVAEVKALPRSSFIELDAQARSFNAMLGALVWFQTYLPKSLVRRLIRRGERAVVSKERELTILFTDLVGFSRASEALSAMDMADLLNEHFALLGRCIEDEEGTIDKFIGDSLMAFWGAPDPQPDHADRALRAAVAMVRAMHEDNARRREAGLAPVRARVGLHSGPAVVGNIGAPERMNYTVVGDTVNTARRMENLGRKVAPDAEVVLLASESTVAAMTIELACEPVGAFTVKNRVEPVEAFRILP